MTTDILLAHVPRLTAIELDPALADALAARTDPARLTVVHGDAFRARALQRRRRIHDAAPRSRRGRSRPAFHGGLPCAAARRGVHRHRRSRQR
ncbi:hypothetical protein [Actinomadura sp. KC345]|uniref:hypothetical protein n=1 Tax=Actinomadura sp. KC345 TaxID=2530371 RepID=UPI0032618B89